MDRRTPIVAILGHVDHGKTTLLDYIRKTNVADSEAGGITQCIGAYKIKHDGKEITFIDTPGHAAFSKMRAHGAQAADLAILIIAANDGVMPQTKNAIKHIKEAKIPFIVVINKIDVEGANIEKTKNDLIKSEVYLGGMGGDVSFQEISALKGKGINELLDLINLTAEVEEISYNPDIPGEGIVLTSNRDHQKGIIVGVVIKNGSIKKGNQIFSESSEGKIKILTNYLGEQADEIKAGSPALIIGFNNLPEVGEKFKIGKKPEKIKKSEKVNKSMLEDNKGIKVVVKANETGSLEAVTEMVNRLSKDLPVIVINNSVGNICESDLKNASNFSALIIGFGVKVDKAASTLVKTQNVDVITSDIIYKLEDELKEYIEENTEKEKRLLEVLAVFGKKDGKQIIGGKVIKDYIENQENFEVLLNNEKIGEGRIINLQSEKKDIQKAEEEQEVGLLVESEVDILKGQTLAF